MCRCTMTWFFRISVICSVIIAVYIGLSFNSYETPKFDFDEYWGPGSIDDYKHDPKIRRFKIEHPIELIDKLRLKLSENYTFPLLLMGAEPAEYGINSSRIEILIKYWRDEYLPKWDRRLLYINTFPNYVVEVQGLKLHYIHIKPSYQTQKVAVPLLLIHSWPGSVVEFHGLISFLTEPDDGTKIAFEIIVPSLPGFGWSDATTRQGLGPTKIAVLLMHFMYRLGCGKFMILSGDIGSVIGNSIAKLYPENVLAFHSSLCLVHSPQSFIKWMVASLWPSLFIPSEYQNFTFPMSTKFKMFVRKYGISYIQATKTDTISAIVNQHPIGLAIYILELFEKSRGLITLDALLDNIMIYYLNNNFATAIRFFGEAYSKEELSYDMRKLPVTVPMGCTRFQADGYHMTDWQLTEEYTDLIHSTYHNVGGRHAAFESPELVYNDFIMFIKIYLSKWK